MQRAVKATKRLSRLLTFRVNTVSSDAIVEGQFDATYTDNGTGDFTLTFAVPFLRAPMVVVSPLTSATILQISSVSTTAVRILFFSATDGTTAKDSDFHALVMGWDTADQT